MLPANVESQLKYNPLTYRSILTIPEKVKFGLEFEMEGVDYEWLYFHFKYNFSLLWSIKPDRSLNSQTGAEIVSPVLYNNTYTWELLKKLGQLLKKLNPDYSNSSFQVNLDASLLPTNEDKLRFLKLYAMYEDIIYRFSKGEDNCYRNSLDTYASPIILNLKDRLNRFDDDYILESYSDNKRYGVVFKTKDPGLIEFRTPNATSNPILWQNYITAFYYLVKLTLDRRITNKQLDEYINNFNKTYVLESYEQLREEKALELAKRMFPKKLDEIYFMHQYLGRDK